MQRCLRDPTYVAVLVQLWLVTDRQTDGHEMTANTAQA